MSAAALRQKRATKTVPSRKGRATPSLTSSLASSLAARSDEKLASLSTLASTDIETPLVANLSKDLHALFDPVSEDVLPIYFGPLLGRLYLEGL